MGKRGGRRRREEKRKLGKNKRQGDKIAERRERKTRKRKRRKKRKKGEREGREAVQGGKEVRRRQYQGSNFSDGKKKKKKTELGKSVVS